MTFLSSESSLEIATSPLSFSRILSPIISSATYGMVTSEQEEKIEHQDRTYNRTLDQLTFHRDAPQRDFWIWATSLLERSIGSGFEEVTNEFDS